MSELDNTFDILTKNKLNKVSFENANLSGAKLAGSDFSDVDFNGAVLIECDLSYANLTNAQLVSANLQNANLNYANLTNANLQKADLRGAQLENAILSSANFASAQLNNANFSQRHSTRFVQKPYEQLRKMAFYDVITGVYNRQAFEEFFEKELIDAVRYDNAFALFLLDLDNFKMVNDMHGHLIGDALLKEVASRLQKLARQGDLISRFGGDEFALYFKGVRTEVDSTHIAEKIINVISQPYLLENISVAVGTSIGIYYWIPGDIKLNTHDILSYADAALYFAKSNGKNCYQHYSKDQ